MTKHKIAVVVGGSRGIGAAIATTLAGRGMTVALTYSKDEAGAAATVQAIAAASGEAVAIRADVRLPGDIDALFTEVGRRFGRIDVLVNCAGIAGSAPLGGIDWDFLSNVIDVNLKAAIMTASRALPLFTDDGGSIVTIGSALATQPLAGQVAYAASKGGLESVTRVLAAELGARNIRVNTVAPGPVATALVPDDPKVHGFLASRTPLGRIGQPDDIARVVALLTSDDAAWITGQVLSANGGFCV